MPSLVREQGNARHHDGTGDQLALLGTKRDEEVAALLGMSTYAVCRKRRSLGIPSAQAKGLERKSGERHPSPV